MLGQRLKLEYRVTERGTWDYPEEGYHIIRADFELDVEEIIEENQLEASDLPLYTLKDFIESETNINDLHWCDVEYQDQMISLDTIWHYTLDKLRCEKIYFLETMD